MKKIINFKTKKLKPRKKVEIFSKLVSSQSRQIDQNSKSKPSYEVDNQFKSKINLKQIRPKTDLKLTTKVVKQSIQNASKSINKNSNNLINSSSISKIKYKEKLLNSNNSIQSLTSDISKANILPEDAVLYDNSVNKNPTKVQNNNKNSKFVDYKLNFNLNQNNKEIFYLSAEEQNFYKKPNRTELASPEKELIISNIPFARDCFIKNKYKYLLENYMKIALNSSGRL